MYKQVLPPGQLKAIKLLYLTINYGVLIVLQIGEESMQMKFGIPTMEKIGS